MGRQRMAAQRKQRKLACSLVASLVLVSAAISNQKTGPGEAFDLGDAALSNAVQLIEESEELRDGAVLTRGHHHEMLRDARLPNSPHAEPPALLEKRDQSAQELAATVARARDDRDRFWNQWHAMRDTCRKLRQQNTDFEEEVLAHGHMILLGLEMKIAVEKKSHMMRKGELPPQEQYKHVISSQQAAQKRSYKSMIKNRRLADKVCAREKQMEDKYKELMGQYRTAALHLKWRLAHGCFQHGLAHYCVSVQQWCGKGSNTRPCVAHAKLTSGSDSEEGLGSMSLLQVSQDTVDAAKLAVQKSAWPKRKSCFWQHGKRHCTVVREWMRHSGAEAHGLFGASVGLPAQSFLPRSIEIHLGAGEHRP